ncbi:acylphosphatase [Phytoactinopolyspora halotolerans]|uniref:acylphosphatase n=1 Tax=Phytoactinopolyspora halotolerans TaxID=1981512 RepID=A0A6L9S9X1_9ACTN|nr:acylphosphatase [Phytoactinopolyspora halotolerans]NEE01434.1 ATP-grasp domain-containing protein [Phytoactinopolyspora halotolerans]
MPWNNLTLTNVRASEFRVPLARRSESRPDARNVLITIDAAGRRHAARGWGEGLPRGRAVTGDTSSGSWRFLEAALERIEGRTLRRRPAAARADIEVLMTELRELAVETARTRSTRARSSRTGDDAGPIPYRGMLAGLEWALVDTAARAADVTVAELLGGSRAPVRTCAIVDVRGTRAGVRRRLARAAGTAAIKLVGATGDDAVLEAALRAADATGAGTPLWLEPATRGARADQVDTVKLARALADRIAAGELPRGLILQLPAGADALDEFLAAQAAVGAADADGAGLQLVADVASAADATAAAEHGLRAVHLDPQRLGGPSAVLTLVRDLSLRPALSVDAQASDVSARALIELAAALPHVTYCAIPVTPASAGKATRVGLNPPLTVDADGTATPGSGPGLGGIPVLTPAVSYLTRHADGPNTPARTVTYEGLPANSYDVTPLLPFATADGEIKFPSPLIERAALCRGLNTVRLSRRTLLVDHPELGSPLCFTPSKSAWTGTPAHRLSVDKELTRAMLTDAGVPVPQGRAFGPEQIEEAVAYASSLGTPAVVKPRNGIHGTGVSTDLRTEEEVRAAIASLDATSFGGRPFIVETYIPGDDYRLLVVGDRVVSVVLKKPASVLGDGSATVTELVLEKNRRRLENPHTRSCLLAFDDNARYWLGRQGLTPDSVPADGQLVRLGSAGNIAAGGDSIEVLDDTHPSLLDLAVRAVQAIPGLDHAGIDLMGDHRLGVDAHPAAIIEVNGNPATSFNHFPLAGTPRDVSSDLVLRSCDLAGFDPGPVRDRLTVRITVEGRVQSVGYRQWFASQAQTRKVTGWVRNRPEGGVEAVVRGPADDVWVLASCAVIGPRKANVTSVNTVHVAEPDGEVHAGEFQIRE